MFNISSEIPLRTNVQHQHGIFIIKHNVCFHSYALKNVTQNVISEVMDGTGS